MQNKKRVSIFIGLIVISLIGISIVSASWFSELFRIGKSDNLEGELESKPATAFVNVTGAAGFPRVYFVSDPNDTVLLPASATNSQFSFLACSPAGETYLPESGEVATRVNGTFIVSYGVSPNPKSVGPISCSLVGSVPGSPSGCGGNSRNYSCTVRIYYYYDVGTWTINASIRDDDGVVAYNNTKTFNIGQLAAIELAPNYLNWTNVEIAGSVQHSDNNLTVRNNGNTDVNDNAGNPLQVNATRLINVTSIVGGPSPSDPDYITANNFSAADNNPTCVLAGTSLSQDSYVNIPLLINHSLSTPTTPQNDTVDFCLSQLMNIGVAAYQQTRNWEIRIPLEG